MPTPAGTSNPTGETSVHGARLLAMVRKATIGEYEIRGEIGRGGMAAVYLAYDLRLNRKVAIKVMLPELALHEGMEDRFRREARTAAKLDHPNIVVIYSVRDDAELLYFVMKFIEGASLEQLVRKHAPLAIPVAQHVLVQLANALQYAHDEGVVHRDVKPANVLVDRRGNALVTDFGIAKATESPTLTRTGSVIGTPAYMSPEQCMGNDQTHASDQYALGVVAYELIAGRPPFVGPSVELQWAHVKTQPPPLLDARPDCPRALADAVMRMLAKEPTERWPSLHAALPALATGLVAGDDSPRAKLAELVRVAAPVQVEGMLVTPASPIPKGRVAVPVSVASVRVHPPSAPLEAGAVAQLTCSVLSSTDSEIQGREVDWASSNPRVASITSTGEVTAHAVGRTTIGATCEAITGTITIEVVPERVTAVFIAPTTLTLEQHAAGRLSVRATDARGKSIAGRQVAFRSAQPGVAVVGADGTVTGRGIGRTVIEATVDDHTATAEVVITPVRVASISITPEAPALTAGDAITFAASLGDVHGRPVVDRPVTWTSSNSATLAIDASGRAVSHSAGAAEVTATADGVRATARVIVAPAPITHIEIVAAEKAVRVGKRTRLRVVAHDRTGRQAEPQSVAWSSTDAAIATITPDGSVAGIAPGRATLVARVGDHQASTVVDVAASTRRAVPLVVPIGGGVLAAAVAAVLLLRDPATTPVPAPATPNAPLPSPPPSSPQPSSPQPSSPQASSPQASSPQASSQPTPAAQPAEPAPQPQPDRPAPPPSAPATMTDVRVTSRPSLALERGETSRATVEATMSDGTSSPARGVRWTSADPSVADVNATGIITARAEGRTSVTATAGSFSTRIDVAVANPAPARVVMSQRTASLKSGETTSLNARVQDRRGGALSYQITWRSSNPSVATVDATGTVRGVRAGEGYVLATAGGAVDSVRVSVQETTVAVSGPSQPETSANPNAAPPRPTGPATPSPSSAPSASEMDGALVSAGRALADRMARGDVSQLQATSQFQKFVRDDRPQLAGDPTVRNKTFVDGRITGEVALPLRWKTFTGNQRSETMVLRITLERQRDAWQRVSAENLTNP